MDLLLRLCCHSLLSFFSLSLRVLLSSRPLFFRGVPRWVTRSFVVIEAFFFSFFSSARFRLSFSFFFRELGDSLRDSRSFSSLFFSLPFSSNSRPLLDLADPFFFLPAQPTDAAASPLFFSFLSGQRRRDALSSVFFRCAAAPFSPLSPFPEESSEE